MTPPEQHFKQVVTRVEYDGATYSREHNIPRVGLFKRKACLYGTWYLVALRVVAPANVSRIFN